MKVRIYPYIITAKWSDGSICLSLRSTPTIPPLVKYWNDYNMETAVTTIKNIFTDNLTDNEREYVNSNMRVVG